LEMPKSRCYKALGIQDGKLADEAPRDCGRRGFEAKMSDGGASGGNATEERHPLRRSRVVLSTPAKAYTASMTKPRT